MIQNIFKFSVVAMMTVLAACGGTSQPDSMSDSGQENSGMQSGHHMGNGHHGGMQEGHHGGMQGHHGMAHGADMQSKAYFVEEIGDRVYFDTAVHTLSPEAKSTLSDQAVWLRKYAANSMISIEGHADERGTRDYNLALGARRANSVRNYLAAKGVPVQSMSTVSYGKERPAVSGSNPSAWSKNRRVVIIPQ